MNRFQEVRPDAEVDIMVDNQALLSQLKDIGYTMDFVPYSEEADHPDLDIDLAVVMKAAKRKSPKYQWLLGIIESIATSIK
ncbi:hypothetical protein JCM19236_4089 [Vibrio sp. JCM 19236]|nr:hypothetical protein JCM19236_4089 [Vibrio sp. JCM 19236]